jgi:gluconate kinase
VACYVESVRDFTNWIPIRVYAIDDGLHVQWFRIGDLGIDDTYFFDTIGRAAKRPFNLAFGRTTSIEEAGRLSALGGGLEPSGFVLHMSRCGSTLVSKSLALRADTLVISEAGPINDVLTMSAPGASSESRALWLRWIVELLSRARRPDQTRVIFKLDAWHARYLPVLQQAFPNVPWVFLHRDPLEVLVSHMHAPSYMMSAANAPSAIGMEVTDAIRYPRAEYCARVLSAIIDGIKQASPPSSRLVAYTELPEAIWGRIAEAFGIEFSESEIARVREGARYHAKRPQFVYEPDDAAKQAAATDEVKAAAASIESYRWVQSPIRQ